MSDAAGPSPLPPEDSKMEIHKPHAAKSWKEIFIELLPKGLGLIGDQLFAWCNDFLQRRYRAGQKNVLFRNGVKIAYFW
jgi:hypothetical protein